MAHYFDDTFSRHVSQPRTGKPALRRSSTSRSIGARSDFDAPLNGGDDEEEIRSMGNSVATDNPDRERERNEANAHVAQYVSEQLERVRSRDSTTFENEDEYEAQLDGH
jgi:hypothetical protein